MKEDELHTKLFYKIYNEVLRPDFSEEKKKLSFTKSKLVHYTSAEAALKIIRSKNIWLRQTKLMNDYSEIEYGINQLLDTYNSDFINSKFIEFFSLLSPTLGADFERAFNEQLNQFRFNTYVLSIAEHEFDENNYGRLSMWRAYGRSSGVAIVINPEYMEDESSSMAAVVIPTKYLNKSDFEDFILKMVERCFDKLELFKQLPLESVLWMFHSNFAYIVMGTKHPGFSEEKEWRVIANPSFLGNDGLRQSIETISGVPQKVLNMPIGHIKDEVGKELTLNKLIDRIIIGPSSSAYEIRDALAVELEESGVEDPYERLHVSNIPYRNNLG